MSAGRTADTVRIRTALESKIVRQELLDYGLTPEEVILRINTMSDEQIRQLATHTALLQAEGDVGGDRRPFGRGSSRSCPRVPASASY